MPVVGVGDLAGTDGLHQLEQHGEVLLSVRAFGEAATVVDVDADDAELPVDPLGEKAGLVHVLLVATSVVRLKAEKAQNAAEGTALVNSTVALKRFRHTERSDEVDGSVGVHCSFGYGEFCFY